MSCVETQSAADARGISRMQFEGRPDELSIGGWLYSRAGAMENDMITQMQLRAGLAVSVDEPYQTTGLDQRTTSRGKTERLLAQVYHNQHASIKIYARDQKQTQNCERVVLPRQNLDETEQQTHERNGRPMELGEAARCMLRGSMAQIVMEGRSCGGRRVGRKGSYMPDARGGGVSAELDRPIAVG
ncbi:hypothetical protein B0T16DRAFT_393292 [Cercophora newfieldiana]|uniref:Uncharacterized protein n=1 Tax=Cercophora newfieldiana TaxID=92897 RepID=A0AA39XVA7_9PEZI|nr:hypothetical protein B0T16DRAFT_393292 [Cercophora newfieldiana]